MTTVARKNKPQPSPTTSKTVRFPNDLLEEVEKTIRGTTCTFSAFVVAATRAALEERKGGGE